jgi:carboxymethylenebutenolidase
VGEYTTLMARDGHEFNAWLSAPPQKSAVRGALVVAQEIFGVNRHIRRVADDYAAQGYVTIAPCLYDRVRRGIELGYSEKEVQEGRGYRLQIPKEKTLLDLTASLNVVKHAGRVAVIGYCWGGTLAYLAACEMPVACAVSYYGGQIKDHLGKSPRRPVMYHFGERDPHIPMSDVDRIRAADPNGIFHLYPADHGFNCEDRDTYDAASARLARDRTLAFLTERMESK